MISSVRYFTVDFVFSHEYKYFEDTTYREILQSMLFSLESTLCKEALLLVNNLSLLWVCKGNIYKKQNLNKNLNG